MYQYMRTEKAGNIVWPFIQIKHYAQVGVTVDGKLNGVKIEYYTDCGCSPNGSIISFIGRFADNSKFEFFFT